MHRLQPGNTLAGEMFDIPAIPDYDPAMPDADVQQLFNELSAIEIELIQRMSREPVNQEENALLQDAFDLLQTRMVALFNDWGLVA